MEKRLKNYLEKMRRLRQESGEALVMEEEVRQRQEEDLMVQISFFQHERLIHLIVTVLFALMTMMVVVGIVLTKELILCVLLLALMVLLVPYIRHYYILENGVQELYTYYDWLQTLKK